MKRKKRSDGFYHPKGRGPVMEDTILAKLNGLSAYAIVVLFHLWTRWNRREDFANNNSHLSVDYDELLRMCTMSRAQVYNALQELEFRGWIVCTHRGGPGGKGGVSTYLFTEMPSLPLVAKGMLQEVPF